MMSSVDPNTSGNVKVDFFYYLPYLDTHETESKHRDSSSSVKAKSFLCFHYPQNKRFGSFSLMNQCIFTSMFIIREFSTI